MTDTPRTEAGRALLEAWYLRTALALDQDDVDEMVRAILAIEAEAAAPDAEYERLQRIETAARALDLRPDRAITDGNAIAALRDALGDKPT